ncbi:MAG: nuclear transport factor 2 family protein [Flavobacteriaceae bacterium]|nr:nuclear transport factor 2 family protein [Flavobacteriaceae bacterium]
MKNPIKILCPLLMLFISCNTTESKDSVAKYKAEVIQVEKDFNDLAQKIGIADAFYEYAANDGVIRKSGKLVEGKVAIQKWIKNDVRPNETLTWVPTFVDVSRSGDLAYTNGDATFTFIDSLGNKKVKTSVYHTVWKRQKDGTWKFVWD